MIATIKPSKPFKFDISDNLPIIKFNKVRIYQLFQNLFSNSIKYNDKTEGYVSVKCNYEKENNLPIEFHVSDNGIGIHKENYENIFQLFRTEKMVETHNGTGIGLAIVKKIINSLEGTIRVESEVGKGSTFIFSISRIFFIS